MGFVYWFFNPFLKWMDWRIVGWSGVGLKLEFNLGLEIVICILTFVVYN